MTIDNRVFPCPFCSVQTQHTLIAQQEYHLPLNVLNAHGEEVAVIHYRTHRIFRCVVCQKDTYRLYQRLPPISAADAVDPQPEREIHQYPVSTLIGDQSKIPAKVRDAWLEAERCLSAGAANACGTMTRRAVDALAQDKGAKGKDLFERLADLKAKGLITPDLWDWAEEIRTAGKVGAHPEWEEMTPEEADYALRFLREIIRYVYINPSERQARRLKETKKKTP
jgi:hypothetical protein